MNPKPRVLTIFLYALSVTGLAFVIRDVNELLSLAAPPLVFAALNARKRLLWMILALAIALIGVFINALAFANTGNIIMEVGFIIIRERAVEAFVVISLRLLAIMAAGASLVLSYGPVEVFHGIVHEAGLPLVMAYPLAYSLRIIPVVKRDLDEVLFMRKQRRLGVFLLNPFVSSSVIMSLLAIGYERAKWSGIAAELRGLRKVKIRSMYRPGVGDVLIMITLTIQVLYIVLA